jgi:alpha-N-acetylglucosaminidase
MTVLKWKDCRAGLLPCRRKSLVIVIVYLAVFVPEYSWGQLNVEASTELIRRVVPQYAKHFHVETLRDSSNNAFEVESVADRIVLRGNNGVAVASALYFYIREIAHGQITWNGSNLNLPAPLPKTERIRRESPYALRYYLNYCTFNYSMSWWDWKRWEREIDWMALHGINMPLAITGQEFIWYEVYRELGFSDADLADFFTGPAYFAWFWMGNIDAWGGPLPTSWMKSHRDLQIKILKRQRELGMRPVLPAFTGHVPPSFKRYFPNAMLKQTNWGNGFADTYILDSEDPMFAVIGEKFLLAQTHHFGTDHFYSADTFNENEPPSDDPEFLSALSRRVYQGMKKADKDAIWVMQGWLFYSDRKFWQAPQVKALLDAVPDDKMIILDLATEIEPVWKRTEAFHGKPWIWNMLHNFGGNVSMFGRMEGVASGPAAAMKDTAAGTMKGIGLTMEAIEQNPVLYELMTDHTWSSEPINLDQWLPKYVRNRYGVPDSHAVRAWEVLRMTVYNGKAIRDGAESILVARPTLNTERRWAKTKLNYEPKELLPAWDEFEKAIPASSQSEGFRYDLVDVTRQVLANYALVLHGQVVAAYESKDGDALTRAETAFIQLLEDMDRLLATQPDFILGRWIREARSHGENRNEKDLYERNARNLITLWGDQNNGLHEYSCRQWSGLINGFYKPRWEKFFQVLNESLKKGTSANVEKFESEIRNWEWNWVNSHDEYSAEPIGSPIEEVKSVYGKYRAAIGKSYGE